MIVNVTSGLAFVPMPLKPIYCATKAAMHSYTQSIRVQLKNSSVKVVELALPATKANFNKGQEEINISSMMDVNKLAQAAIRGLERDLEEILPGISPLPHATLRNTEAQRMSANEKIGPNPISTQSGIVGCTWSRLRSTVDNRATHSSTWFLADWLASESRTHFCLISCGDLESFVTLLQNGLYTD